MEESKTMEQEPVTQEEEIVVEDTKAEDVSETADQEEAQAEPETAEEDAGTDKKGFFGKKKEKKDKKDEQIAELTDKLKRQLAEFENFRNRTDKEKSQMYAVGAKDVIEKILPVIDNFERGLKSIPEDQKDGPVASGMEMIYKQLITVLSDLGVTPIEAVGQEFDPNFHNAVMHAEDEELGENTVSEEFQKGYKYKDAVRPFQDMLHGRIVTFQMMLKDEPGILSHMLNLFASSGANILTINQGLPINGCAVVTVNAETSGLQGSLQDLLTKLNSVDGVLRSEVLAG